MKKTILFLLIAFPLLGLGQDISGTGWKITRDDGSKEIILFKQNGTFIYLKLFDDSGNEGVVFCDDDDSWKVDGNRVVILFNDGYMIYSGVISTSGDYMSGISINKKGAANKWSGTLIKF